MPEPETLRPHQVVRRKAQAFIAESWQSQTNLAFFLALQIMLGLILPSLGFGKSDEQLYGDIGLSLMLISGVAIAWGRRWLFLLAGFFCSAAIAIRWIAFFTPTPKLLVWSAGWSLAAIAVLVLVLLAEVFRPGPVTSMRLQGAIAVYLLFGAGWAHAYHLTAFLIPGSFQSPPGSLATVADWFYYSFVTLTTLGYGDITPVHQVARTLAVAEALTGQLYLAITIARLVAMEVVSWQSKANNNSE